MSWTFHISYSISLLPFSPQYGNNSLMFSIKKYLHGFLQMLTKMWWIKRWLSLFLWEQVNSSPKSTHFYDPMTPIFTCIPAIKVKDAFSPSVQSRLLHRDHEFALCPLTFVQNQLNIASLYSFQLLLHSAVSWTTEPYTTLLQKLFYLSGLWFHTAILALPLFY